MLRFCALLAGGTLAVTAEVSYRTEVRPILAERCAPCHNARLASGDVSFATAAAAMRTVKPGEPDASALIAAISGEKPRMPKAGAPLKAEQIALLRRWITEGARDDSNGEAEEKWWSLKPLRKPAGDSIDGFIRARLKAAGIAPSPEADRLTLVRRVYYDLHGLPPSPEQIAEFLNDRAPGAYERLVDRLLASPRYGERWARHWLDVVHYGDSHGYDKDKPRLNAWPYRDYVIAALNRDKPYARFIREQIAGDILYPADPDAFVATGFLAAGPWDFVGHQELREGTVEKENTRLLDRDDMVATAMSTFVSMTAHCARCHDHKFDPIPQAEYYGLQAVFAGIDRANRPWHPNADTHARVQGITRAKHDLQRELQPLLDKEEFASTPEIVELDSAIQDAGLLLAHLGTPKNPAEATRKAELEARRARDRARRKALVDAIVGAETYARIAKLQAEIKALDAKMPEDVREVYSGAAYFQRAGTFRPSLDPRPVFVLGRGSVQAKLQPAHPSALSAVPVAFDSAAERRAALANWIADRGNMLTWRSIVNRVWHYHFGAGLVDTPSDFGRMGSKPTHPELLDWLAVWFRDDAGGSLKALHRLILTSSAYRQSSAEREDAAKIDADNRLLWRMNATRLDAESVRDSLLAAAGKLDLTAGGRPAQWFWFKDDHSPVYDYSRFNPDDPESYRRSIYRFIVRSVPDPFMERLDCPDPSVLTPKRTTTLTAIQALTMLNNPFVVRMAEHLATRTKGDVAEAVRLCWGREATADELERFKAYSAKHGPAALARVLFNTNEFLFVD